MKKQMKYFVVLLIAMQTIVIYAQTPEKPAPGFTLTLSEGRRDGTMVPYQQVLIVRLTNISNEVNNLTPCESFGGMYNLKVVYDGIPVEETDEERKTRKRMESGECWGSLIAQHTKPGEFREDILYYNTMKPGTYEITATKKTFPGQPDKSVTVRSNTITIVVPEPPLKLTLSENDDLGEGLDRVNVTETNISDKDFIDEDHGCIRELGWFTVEVSYNGVPLAEKDVEARFRRQNEMIDLMTQRNAPCATGPLEIVLKPGKSRKLWLGVSDIYDVTKPGSYEVYVSRETNPIGHINSEYVRSNTITIVVPKPEADEPK
jgi:hypothetical protein